MAPGALWAPELRQSAPKRAKTRPRLRSSRQRRRPSTKASEDAPAAAKQPPARQVARALKRRRVGIAFLDQIELDRVVELILTDAHAPLANQLEDGEEEADAFAV